MDHSKGDRRLHSSDRRNSRFINTSTNMEVNIVNKHQEFSIEGRRDAQREIIRLALDEIATDVGIALRDTGLNA